MEGWSSLPCVWLALLVTGVTSSLGGRNSISHGPDALCSLSGHRQQLMRHVTMTTPNCGSKDMPKLRRKLLRHAPVSCNDGSPAGFYIRKSPGSSKWLVFLEGGWFCFDHASCNERMRVMAGYMSSRAWPRYREGTGILSWDPDVNPYYFHANMVFVPYCSSDSWSGTKNASREGLSFMGSLILEEVVKELFKKGLRNAKRLLVVGSSAGGTGVLINIDRISDLVRAHAPHVEVRGLVDAGWFLDNEPFKQRHCRDAYTCSPTTGINKGIQHWAARLPTGCTERYASEAWRCYFGHRIYPYIKTPVYVLQNLYDAAQIKVDNVFDPQARGSLSTDQWFYLLQLGQDVRTSLQNVSAVFAPSCVMHDVLLSSDWQQMAIDGVTLAQSIYCWEESNDITSGCSSSSKLGLGKKSWWKETPLGDSPPGTGKTSTRRKSRDRKRKRRRNRKRRKNKERRAQRAKRSACRRRLVDNCPWPHCNCSCPRCRWDTVAELRQFFRKSLAQVMGIQPERLENINLCGY